MFPADADMASIAACISRYRVALIRGAVSSSLLNLVHQSALSSYETWDERADRGDMPKDVWSIYAQGHVPVESTNTEALFRLANTGFIGDLVSIAFQCRREIMPTTGEMQIRRIKPPSAQHRPGTSPRIVWHQDEYFAVASTPGSTAFPLAATMWLPLVPCGVDAPGLSVVLRSDRPIINGYPRVIGWERYIRWRYGARSIWSPEMRPGDLLIFTSRVIHGSYVTPEMRSTRYSVELRCGINNRAIGQ